MSLRTSCLLTVALLLAGSRLDAICFSTVPPGLVRARIEACHVPEAEIRRVMEPYRARHQEWVASLPEHLWASRSFDAWVHARLSRGEVVAKLKVLRRRQLSAPWTDEERTAGPWRDAEGEQSAEEYLVRMGSMGCDALAVGTEQLLLEDSICCDVVPPEDNACLLHLWALKPVPEEIEAKFGAVP